MDIFQQIHDDHMKVDQVFKRLAGESQVNGNKAANQIGDLLLPHAKAEEATVYPTLRQHEDARELVELSLQQHQRIEQRLRQLARVPSGNEDQVRTQLDQLQSAVQEHVDLEEDETFSAMRELLGRDQLEELSRSFPREKQSLQGQFRLAA